MLNNMKKDIETITGTKRQQYAYTRLPIGKYLYNKQDFHHLRQDSFLSHYTTNACPSKHHLHTENAYFHHSLCQMQDNICYVFFSLVLRAAQSIWYDDE